MRSLTYQANLLFLICFICTKTSEEGWLVFACDNLAWSFQKQYFYLIWRCSSTVWHRVLANSAGATKNCIWRLNSRTTIGCERVRENISSGLLWWWG